MILMILATLLVLGITLYQVLQGTFSAWIMAVLTTLCAAVALATYEPLAEAWLYERQPAYADGVALMALFVVPLLVLRIVIDLVFTRNVTMNDWVGRVGGGVLGFVTAQVLVGMLLIAMQMLPMGRGLLYYEPFDADLKRQSRCWPFCPDDFTLALLTGLDGSALKGERTFDEVHDNLLRELYCRRNTAGEFGRLGAKPDALVVESCESWQPWDDLPEYAPLTSQTDTKAVAIRVAVSETARNAEDDWWRLPGTHFRLITTTNHSYYPVAFQAQGRPVPPRDPEREERKRSWAPKPLPPADIIYMTKWNEEGGPEAVGVTWIYRIPADETPDEIVFRGVARDWVPADEREQVRRGRLTSLRWR